MMIKVEKRWVENEHEKRMTSQNKHEQEMANMNKRW